MKDIQQYMQKLDTKDVVDGLLNGRFPLKNQSAKPGEPDYYFYDFDTDQRSSRPFRNPWSKDDTQATKADLSSSDLGWNNQLSPSWSSSSDGVQYAQNTQTTSNDGTTTAPQPIVSDEFLNQLGFDESTNNYAAVNKGGSARGKYQMQKLALEDIGMIDKKGNWLGKYGVYSQNDFLNNPEAQEKAIHDFFNLYHKRYNQLLHKW